MCTGVAENALQWTECITEPCHGPHWEIISGVCCIVTVASFSDYLTSWLFNYEVNYKVVWWVEVCRSEVGRSRRPQNQPVLLSVGMGSMRSKTVFFAAKCPGAFRRLALVTVRFQQRYSHFFARNEGSWKVGHFSPRQWMVWMYTFIARLLNPKGRPHGWSGRFEEVIGLLLLAGIESHSCSLYLLSCPICYIIQ
jgi:hypothetical protein